jgi:hypothetical protein
MAKNQNTKHQSTLKALAPIIKHVQDNQIPHLLLVGQNGQCARFLETNSYDLTLMIESLCNREPKLYDILEYIVNSRDTTATNEPQQETAIDNIFHKYIVDVNPNSIELADEAFLLFKELYDTHYGSIKEDDNLISIHTGGWSKNEELICDFKLTSWWYLYHEITSIGGHYFFNTDIDAEKRWKIISHSS